MTVDFTKELQQIHIFLGQLLTLLYGTWPLQGKQGQPIVHTALVYPIHLLSMNESRSNTHH